MEKILCDTCGAECTPTAHTSGYSEDIDGKRHCFKCCGDRDRASMIESGCFLGYLYKDGRGAWNVTNWPGSLLFNVASQRKSKHNIGRERVDVWFKGPEGARWHGVHIGDNNQIVHCKRTKGR